jgi:hypothetical protein
MLMPKTTVNEYYGLEFGENEVGFAGQLFGM